MEQERCTLFGYLFGALCADLNVWDRIAGARLVALPSERQDTPAHGFNPRQVASRTALHDIDEARFKQLAADGFMEGETDEKGFFCLRNAQYDGRSLDLYACIDRIPTPSRQPGHVPLEQRSYLFLGTYQPFRFGDTWYLVLVIPAVFWCRIRAKADLWVILGRVAPCADTSIGLGNLTVTAKDVDLVQHDVLGTAVTNANGVFRIDYPGSAFRQGTWIDLELFGGPDVFFSIEDQDGNVLLDEPPSRGRAPGRCDRKPCFCVRLCVEIPVPPVGTIPSIWTQVGNAFVIPDSGGLNDFDADGYAGAPKYAFFSTLRMVGSAPPVTAAGNPVEYRFLVSDTTTPNGAAPPPDAAFTRAVGVGPDVNLFARVKIGQMIRYSPLTLVDVFAEQVDLDADGWLDVNTSITRTFATHPTLTPADLPDFDWVDLDALMGIHTGPLTAEADVPAAVGDPGDAVPAGNRIGIERKAIRFQIREVVDKATSTFNPLPGTNTTLNAIVVNNNNLYAKVAMKEHLESTACTPLTGSPHVAFTAHHPHIASVNVNVLSNDGTYNHNLNDAATRPATSHAAIPLAGNTNSPVVNHLHDPSVDLPAGLHKCTYLVTLSVQRRLHTGDGAIGTDVRHTTFYYEP